MTMAIRRNEDDEDNEDNEEQEAKEELAELIKNIKATKQLFFAFVPKGSRGKVVVCTSKTERDQAAKELKKELNGGTPVLGTCLGSPGRKVFKLDKEPEDPDVLSETIKKVLRLQTKLNVVPDLQLKRGPLRNKDDEDE
jgi:imidazoleglycerol phosphate synthase glutamine amidotransferase subunit HisH